MFDFLFKKKPAFTASKAEFDSILAFASINSIEISKETLINHIEQMQQNKNEYSYRLFLCINDLMMIDRNCQIALCVSRQYKIDDEYGVAKMLEATQKEAFNLAIELYANKIKDPIAAIKEEIKRIDSKLDDFKEYCRKIAMSELKS